MAKVLLTGSFDPITRGHFAMIEIASRAFDEVTVCMFINPDKTYMFDQTQRLLFIREGIEELNLTNVKVDFSKGYVADYAKAHGIGFVARGVRNEDDMPYELEMARYNHKLNPELETWIWASTVEDAGISSTAVRESLKNGKIPTDMLLSSTVRLIGEILNIGGSI